MSSTRKSFVQGAAILGVTSMLVKVIGVLYRIPLANILTDEGMGLYQSAYPIYTYLLMLSTAGLPPTISKLVAARVAKNNHADARKVFRMSLAMMFVLGLICSICLFVFSAQFADLVKDPLARLPIAYIAPAIVLVSVMGAIRGYFQGLQNMIPTALSQLAEQVGKVIFGIYLALKWGQKGIQYAAAGAVVGVVISELIGLCVIILYFVFKSPRIPKNQKSKESSKDILNQLISLAFPILLGASIMPLINTIDASLVRGRLMEVGYTLKSAREMFGLFSGKVNTLVNVPGSISLGFCVSIVPAVSAAISRKSKNELDRNITLAYKMILIIGVPSAVGLGILAYPIMNLLYGNSTTAENLLIGSQLLQMIAGGVIFLSILQTFNGILQGMGKVYVPVIALTVGAITKVLLANSLIAIPSVNIYGAPISTFACYFVASIIDIIMVKRFTGVKLNRNNFNIKIVLASIFMGVAVWAGYTLFTGLVGSKISTIISVVIGIIVFFLGLVIFKVLDKDEMLSIPGGRRLVILYNRIWER